MADDSFHLIISGERGRVLHIPFSRKKLRFFAICSSVMALVLVLGCTFTLYSVNKQATRMVFTANTGGPSSEVERLQQQLTRLQSQLNARENLTEITDSEVLKEKEAIVQNTLDELAERNTLLDQLFQRVGIIPAPSPHRSAPGVTRSTAVARSMKGWTSAAGAESPSMPPQTALSAVPAALAATVDMWSSITATVSAPPTGTC